MVAYLATAGIVLRKPPPPIQIGRGFCGPLGLFMASCNEYQLPLNVDLSCFRSWVTTSMPSSKRSNRSSMEPSSIPYASHSSSFHPAPIPSSSLPFEVISNVEAIFASTAGWR